jgi:hypothetical protein
VRDVQRRQRHQPPLLHLEKDGAVQTRRGELQLCVRPGDGKPFIFIPRDTRDPTPSDVLWTGSNM